MGNDSASRSGKSGYREVGRRQGAISINSDLGLEACFGFCHSMSLTMHRNQIGGTFMLRRCGRKTPKAHAQHRRNEKPAASAKAKEQGKENNPDPWEDLKIRSPI